MTASAFPFADLALPRRLERAEGTSCATYAVFDGPASPITQTFGLGMFQPPTEADFDALEAFFRDRGAPVFHEVSPLADPATLALLTERGYQPFEFTSV